MKTYPRLSLILTDGLPGSVNTRPCSHRLYVFKPRSASSTLQLYVAANKSYACCSGLVSVNPHMHIAKNLIWGLKLGQTQLANSLTRSFQTEIEDQIRLIKDRARDVRFEVELAKTQSDYQEQQHERRERASASSHRLALTSFISRSDAEISEAQHWRATMDRRKKGTASLQT
jgi:hypothetical protein